MPHGFPIRPVSLAFALSLSLSGCLFEEEPPGPTIQGHFGDRLEGLPPFALLDSSEKALAMMREASGDSYTYRLGYGGFGGSGYRDVTVRAGVPVRGETVSRPWGGEESRLEEGAERLAERMAEGEAITLPQLYAECRALLSGDTAYGGIRFGYDGNYIIENCEHRDSRLKDGFPALSVQMRNWAWK